MTRRTWVGDFVFVGHGRGDECKGVRAHFDVGDGCLDLGHVARHTLAARRAVFVVSMLLQLPKILQPEPSVIADRPVEVLAFDRIGERTTLRVALDASVVLRSERDLGWISCVLCEPRPSPGKKARQWR
jgi:hypothetical protein